MELNNDSGRRAEDKAKLPPRIVRPPKPAGLRLASGAEILKEVDGRATAGDVKRTDIEVVVEGVPCGGGHVAVAGAFGEAAGGSFADVTAIRNRTPPPAAGPAARTPTSPSEAIWR